MSAEKGYFHTEWASLTTNDWVGLIVTVVVAALLVVAYLYVFHPKNKERLESQRFLVDGVDGETSITEDSIHGENK